jgi:hypothetical protein
MAPRSLLGSLARRARRALALAAAALAASALVASCAGPTLPLPPPDAPDTIREATTAGEWEVTGSCVPGSIVVLLNDRTGEGAVVEDRDESGRYTATLEGELCDLVRVWQTTDDDDSASTSFALEPREKDTPGSQSVCK